MMIGWASVFVALSSVTGIRPAAPAANPALTPGQLADRVRGVFAARCAGCHGPGVERPPGGFGYVLDLERVAGNPGLVVRRRPDQSELWALVEHDEMPPPDSPRGALSPAQKESIRAWIAAGAPDAPPLAPRRRLMRWLGKFHLLLLHFPIALALAAGLGELGSAWRRDPLPSDSVRFCLWAGALAAIPTACLGWVYALAGDGPGLCPRLAAHGLLGTTAAACLVVTALCAERDDLRYGRGLCVRLLLLLCVPLTALTAHLGGLLGRGGDFFPY